PRRPGARPHPTGLFRWCASRGVRQWSGHRPARHRAGIHALPHHQTRRHRIGVVDLADAGGTARRQAAGREPARGRGVLFLLPAGRGRRDRVGGMNAAPADAVVHVVDDDDAYRKSLLRLLEAKHYRTAAYASAEEFLAANVTAHGCILLDVRMPGMSGLQLQQALASRHGTPPIIFLTGHPSVPSAVTAMKGGAEDFLSKTV